MKAPTPLRPPTRVPDHRTRPEEPAMTAPTPAPPAGGREDEGAANVIPLRRRPRTTARPFRPTGGEAA